uniref:Uncharacterized protein n=1 Tax=Lophocladia kuetzingii TaxID=675577 RepID=A0A1Z1MNK9_9FLOR|nr:hypothetical protein [Lophocladia kuetzingii]ARW67680.1 hypothetical protein [Lophocladia kuetzingii]
MLTLLLLIFCKTIIHLLILFRMFLKIPLIFDSNLFHFFCYNLL